MNCSSNGYLAAGLAALTNNNVSHVPAAVFRGLESVDIDIGSILAR